MEKISWSFTTAALIVVLAVLQPVMAAETASRTIEDGGTGTCKAVVVGDDTIATHTIYRPADLSAFGNNKKLPIIAWGNGGCANSSSGHENFLSEIASHGYIIVAIGPMQSGGGQRRGSSGMPAMGGGIPSGARRGGAPAVASESSSADSQLIAAIDWAIAQNEDSSSPYYNKIDTNKICVSGMSCGGLQALEASPDPRVTTAMICNSGIFNTPMGDVPGMPLPKLSKEDLKKLHSPIIYILGGESDMAYPNGMDDYKRIDHVPALTASLEGAGHGGTYMQPHGGEFAIVALAWLNWQLKGDTEAAKMFVGEPSQLEQREGWSVQKKNLDIKEEKTPSETASRTIEDGGTGPYSAIMVTDGSLATHTIFRPKDMSVFGSDNKLPVIAWGNGACTNSPWEHLNFLSEIASHGFLVIAIGPMPQQGQRGQGNSSASQLTDAIDWAIAQNKDSNSQYYNKIATDKICVSGMSCGGLQALSVANNPRVTTVMICNSGIFSNSMGGLGGMGGTGDLSKDTLKKLHSPIIYILGGESDMAYPNGMDDFAKIDHVPAIAANLEGAGHGGTYMQPHGGEFAVVAKAWLQWQLKGNKEAAKMFIGNPSQLEQREGWSVQKKSLTN